MDKRQTTTPQEERETVAYSLPSRLVKAVAFLYVDRGFKSKSHAAQEVIERGLASFADQAPPEPGHDARPDVRVA